MQAYFGWAKACSCSYCCSRHFWFYDRGRLGRVEILTLKNPQVPLWVPLVRREGARPHHRSLWLSPFPPLFGSTALLRAKTFARPKKTPVLQAKRNQSVILTSCVDHCLQTVVHCMIMKSHNFLMWLFIICTSLYLVVTSLCYGFAYMIVTPQTYPFTSLMTQRGLALTILTIFNCKANAEVNTFRFSSNILRYCEWRVGRPATYFIIGLFR